MNNTLITDRVFFTEHMDSTDPAIARAIAHETRRQQQQIELIASENIVSKAVLEAQGSILTNKYAEGYPRKRFYGGCEHVDEIETLAIQRAKQLFHCQEANVQPHSGSQANQAVFFALLKPGDTILGMDLSAGGHLTHGAAPNISGKWFQAVHYGLHPQTDLIDYDNVELLAKAHKPRLIIAGGSAYSRIIDFKRMREIADQVGAYLLADVAHYAGLIVAECYPNPIKHAHVVTTTTHKTLRGPRGGLILTNDKDIAKKINSAVFPGLQGGPLMHVIAAKAVAFGEALQPSFKTYASQVIQNARALANTLQMHGFDIISGGTDCHMMLVDLRRKHLTGKLAEAILEDVGLTCNKNAIPNDPESPFITSGIRLGTAAGTTRGFDTAAFQTIGGWIATILSSISMQNPEHAFIAQQVREEVLSLCDTYPIYGEGR